MIKELNLEICCIDKFTARRDAIVEEIAKEKAFAANDDEVDEFEKGYFTRYQRCLWDLMVRKLTEFYLIEINGQRSGETSVLGPR